MSAVTGRTKNLGLILTNFDFPRWHDNEWSNWKAVDAVIALVAPSAKGAWATSTLYTQGDRAIDVDGSTVWQCLVTHTSPATGTFADERTAHPTYWKAFSSTPNNRGVWSGTSVSYLNGDIVKDNNGWYLCVAPHLSDNTTNTTANTGLWTLIVDNTDAINAATNAATSASNAATSESNALASKNAAATSATNAATSETNANTYKSQAASSATSASTSASNASSSASAAATSASNAHTSEVNAANSASAAATSASQAATFDPSKYAALTGAAFTGDVSGVVGDYQGVKFHGGSFGSYTTSGWGVRVKFNSGEALHWAGSGAIGFSGSDFYCMTGGSDALNGTGAPVYNFYSINSTGTLIARGEVQAGQGNGRLGTDGNIWGTVWGSTTISTYIWNNFQPMLANPITLGNFTSYFGLRRSNYGYVGAYGVGSWTVGDPLGIGGAYISSIQMTSAIGHYANYMYMQWLWNGNWYSAVA